MASKFTLDPRKLSGLKAFCVNVIKQGQIPRHIAFIMDGNRRFAKNKNIEQVDGHNAGFGKLVEVISWCRELGINEITVYAFSIENFKRSPEEVENLMNIFKHKFDQLWEERNSLKEHGTCVRVVGNVRLFSKKVQNSLSKVVFFTQDCNKFYLNLAMPYTGRDELHQAIQHLLEGVEQGLIEPDDITEDSLQQCLYTYNSPDPEILIRTSGEVRLSDFLLWQTSYSLLMFITTLWPDFSLWSLLSTLFYYQRTYNTSKDFKKKAEQSKHLADYESIRKKILEKKKCGKNNDDNNNSEEHYHITEEEIVAHIKEREKRLEKFYSHLEKKRNFYWKSMLPDVTD
ncbi:hypothetical protein CHUAL_008742 [Chamberlinius hualienensis]